MCREEERKAGTNLIYHDGKAYKSNTNVLNKAFRRKAETHLYFPSRDSQRWRDQKHPTLSQKF